MKNLIIFVTIYFSLTFSTLSNESNNDCNKFDKLSKEYAKCATEVIKEKSSNVKEITSSKIDIAKSKIKKFDIKKKFKLFKESKSHKEFMEKLKNEN
jgi:hypothetical protein